MRVLLAAGAYGVAFVLMAAIAFSALMVLAAEDQSARIGSLAEFVVGLLGWVTILVSPAYFAVLVWRRWGDATARDSLVTLRAAIAAFFLSLVLAGVLHIYDCFVEGSGQCPTWAPHLLAYVVVFYTPTLLCVWVGKSAVQQWRVMLGGR